jgi:hypothetical protein
VSEWGWYTQTDVTTNLTQTNTRLANSLALLRDHFSGTVVGPVTLATYFVDFDRPLDNYYGLYTDTYSARSTATTFAAHAAAYGS